MVRLKAISERTAIMSTELRTRAAKPQSAGLRRFFSAFQVRHTACVWSTFAVVMLGVGAVSERGAQAQTQTPNIQDAVAPGQASSGNRAANSAAPNVAFFDGAQPPVNLLQAFDAVVIDPASGFDPAGHPLAHTVWIARTHAASGDA